MRNKVYSMFVYENEDGMYVEEHIPYYTDSAYADSRKEEVLSRLGNVKPLGYFASTDLTAYLKYLIRARVMYLLSLIKRNERYIERLKAKDTSARDLYEVRKMQREQENLTAVQLGRTVSRYLKRCNREGKNFYVNDVALECLKAYNETLVELNV